MYVLKEPWTRCGNLLYSNLYICTYVGRAEMTKGVSKGDKMTNGASTHVPEPYICPTYHHLSVYLLLMMLLNTRFTSILQNLVWCFISSLICSSCRLISSLSCSACRLISCSCSACRLISSFCCCNRIIWFCIISTTLESSKVESDLSASNLCLPSPKVNVASSCLSHVYTSAVYSFGSTATCRIRDWTSESDLKN